MGTSGQRVQPVAPQSQADMQKTPPAPGASAARSPNSRVKPAPNKRHSGRRTAALVIKRSCPSLPPKQQLVACGAEDRNRRQQATGRRVSTYLRAQIQGNPQASVVIHGQSIWPPFAFDKSYEPFSVGDRAFIGMKIEDVDSERWRVYIVEFATVGAPSEAV